MKTWALVGSTDSDDFDSLTTISNMTKNGFENSFALDSTNTPSFVSVLALDSDGNTLGRTGVYEVADGSEKSAGTSSYTDSSSSSSSGSSSSSTSLFLPNHLFTSVAVPVAIGISFALCL